MDSGVLGFVLVVLIAITAIAVLVSRDWRSVIAALGLQHLWAFLLITSSWPLELAAVKLVTGWMAAAILGFTILSVPQQLNQSSQTWQGSGAFRSISAGLIILVVLGAAPRLAGWNPAIGDSQAAASLLLLGIGLLQIGFSSSYFRTVIGILTFFSGFEILYAAVEASILVVGLLAAVNLGIALVGTYLIVAPGMESPS
jgi:hypothetical protein